jgi:hypothetical protein
VPTVHTVHTSMYCHLAHVHDIVYQLDSEGLRDDGGIMSHVTGFLFQGQQQQTPWLLVRKRTIPTERQPLVAEI